MQDNNISKIIVNALQVNKDKLSNNIKLVINQMLNSLQLNKEAIEQTNKIDKKNNNGFILNFDIINKIFSNLEKENLFYGDVIHSQKNEENGFIYGTQIMDEGVVVVINDGNPYVIIEMVIRNIMAGNTTILVNNGFMYGTNQLIVKIMQSVLEKFEISNYLIQLYLTDNYEDVLANYANIDLIVCIGNYELQKTILSKSKNRVITSGYDNYELYIEDISHIDFLNSIVNTGLNIQIYINNDTKIDSPNAILVSDVDEAIAQINYNGNKYSSAIFTSSVENASKFLKEVKSKIVTINTSPTIERIIDIKQSDLCNEKTMIYPLGFKLDGKRVDIDLNQKEN